MYFRFPDFLKPNVFSFEIFNFSLALSWYSLSYIFGILISWFIINNYLLKYKKNINKVLINNALNYWIIGIILGGRIGYPQRPLRPPRGRQSRFTE